MYGVDIGSSWRESDGEILGAGIKREIWGGGGGGGGGKG